MKTWKAEMLVVAAILLVVNWLTHKLFSLEVLAALAVLLSFGYAQISSRLVEIEAERAKPSVSCYQKLWYYFIGKEILWILYFFLSHSYSALVGCFIFIAYPVWRKYWRKIKPYGSNSSH